MVKTPASIVLASLRGSTLCRTHIRCVRCLTPSWNAPPVFSGLRPRIWPHLLRLVTKTMSDRLLVRIVHDGFYCCRGHEECELCANEQVVKSNRLFVVRGYSGIEKSF